MTSKRCSYGVASIAFLQVIIPLVLAATSYAWIYPEHRDITVLAIQKLDPARRRFSRDCGLRQGWA